MTAYVRKVCDSVKIITYGNSLDVEDWVPPVKPIGKSCTDSTSTYIY